MKRTASGNTKPPEKDGIYRWVSQARRQVELSVIENFVDAARLGDCHEYMMFVAKTFGYFSLTMKIQHIRKGLFAIT